VEHCCYKYMIECCDGVQKYIDGCLMEIVHADDPDISKCNLDVFDYWDSTYEGLNETEYFENKNKIVFGENTELGPKLV